MSKNEKPEGAETRALDHPILTCEACGISCLAEVLADGCPECGEVPADADPPDPPSNPITFGSVCSGIEAASVAWEPLGWKAAWFAEIEPFPSAVLAHHFPDVENLGDMTGIPSRVLRGSIPAPDVLTGGTPCQSFSVAGMREGLKDPRGELTIKFVEIADATDHVRAQRGDAPCVVVWENVPGVLSDKQNAFGCLLGALAGEDAELQPAGKRWADAGCVYGPQRAIAWRVLDAQYFGLAQRRRRVFLVASARDGFDPAAVLFERESLRRDSPPRREAGQGAAGTVASSSFVGGAGGRPEGAAANHFLPVAGTLRSTDGGSDVDHARGGHIVPVTCMAHGQGGAEIAENRSPTLTCNHEAPIACITGDITHALNTANNGKGCSEDGTERGVPTIATYDYQKGLYEQVLEIKDRQAEQIKVDSGRSAQAMGCSASLSGTQHAASEDVAPSMGAKDPAAVALSIHENQRAECTLNDTAGTIKCAGGKPGQGYPALLHGMSVRRLSPIECERLQGFPDNWTLIPGDRAKRIEADELAYLRQYFPDIPEDEARRLAADGPRYKAIGNSWAVPCARWVGGRIHMALCQAIEVQE